jgi:hypothetical protein
MCSVSIYHWISNRMNDYTATRSNNNQRQPQKSICLKSIWFCIQSNICYTKRWTSRLDRFWDPTLLVSASFSVSLKHASRNRRMHGWVGGFCAVVNANIFYHRLLLVWSAFRIFHNLSELDLMRSKEQVTHDDVNIVFATLACRLLIFHITCPCFWHVFRSRKSSESCQMNEVDLWHACSSIVVCRSIQACGIRLNHIIDWLTNQWSKDAMREMRNTW